MTAHKHAEMIKAKADNMDLFVFAQDGSGGEWYEYGRKGNYCPFYETDNYFLCHPKHKDEVLNSLNGGVSQVKVDDEWCEASCLDGWRGDRNVWYMKEDCESRIKPRREKHWVSVRKEDNYVERYLYASIEDAEADNNPLYWNSYEIEVEV